MSAVAMMVETHPGPGYIQNKAVTSCIDAAIECTAVCILCADACLEEKHVADLRHCIRTNQACADICDATARVLARVSATEADMARLQVETCRAACAACAAVCEEHAAMHRHCKECAQVCRRCEECCAELLRAF